MPASKVYFAKSNSPQEVDKRLAELIKKSAITSLAEKGDFIALKVHFGEEGNIGHIKPKLAKEVIDKFSAVTPYIFLTDTGTIYGGSQRNNAVEHLRLAQRHGFSLETLGAPIIIADGIIGRDYIEIKTKGRHFKTVKIASDIVNSDCLIALSHMTGHCQFGFGAALKNIGMGCACRAGKVAQHENAVPTVNKDKCSACRLCFKWCPVDAIVLVKGKALIVKERCIGCGECIVTCRSGAIACEWGEGMAALQEKMVEYAYGVLKNFQGKAAFLNFLTHITKECDCIAKNEPPIASDIGILASLDPVAIDKASCDLLNEAAGEDLIHKAWPVIDWEVQLNYAAKLGLGSLEYELIRV